MGNPSPQHSPTDGLGTAVQIALSGAGVTTIHAYRQYKVTLSLTGTTSVTLTATLKDAGGNTFTSGNSNSVTWVSSIAGVASVSSGTVTAVAVGQTTVEAKFPTFDTTDGNDFIYVQIVVQVNP